MMKSLCDLGYRTTRPLPNRSVLFLQAIILALSLHGAIAAQGPISAVQEALKREELLFGEPSGVLDNATRDALRLFQTRRGFPATGELDAATMKALQGPTDADPRAIESVPANAPQAKVSDSTLERDREFLRALQAGETSRDQMPPPLPVAQNGDLPPAIPPTPEVTQVLPTPAPPPLRASAAQPSYFEEEHRILAARQTPPVPKPPVAGDPWNSRRLEPLTKTRKPERRTVAAPPPRSRIEIVESENYQDPIEPQGVRIIRSTSTDREGRTVIHERKTYAGTPAPIVRRAQPVEPRRKSAGLFDRIFKDKDKDRDNDDNEDEDDD